MDSFCEQPCILLVLSDAYFEEDPVNNWFCLKEFADAILDIENGPGHRSLDRTIPVYVKNGSLRSQNLAKKAMAALKIMADHFLKEYQAQESNSVFRHYL